MSIDGSTSDSRVPLPASALLLKQKANSSIVDAFAGEKKPTLRYDDGRDASSEFAERRPAYDRVGPNTRRLLVAFAGGSRVVGPKNQDRQCRRLLTEAVPRTLRICLKLASKNFGSLFSAAAPKACALQRAWLRCGLNGCHSMDGVVRLIA